MSAPSSVIVAEIFSQFMGCNNMYNILLKHKVIGYFRYMDYILLIYNDKLTDISLTSHE